MLSSLVSVTICVLVTSITKNRCNRTEAAGTRISAREKVLHKVIKCHASRQIAGHLERSVLASPAMSSKYRLKADEVRKRLQWKDTAIN